MVFEPARHEPREEGLGRQTFPAGKSSTFAGHDPASSRCLGRVGLEMAASLPSQSAIPPLPAHPALSGGLMGHVLSERTQELLALPIPRSLPAVSAMPACSAFRERLPHLDFFAEGPTPLANLLRGRPRVIPHSKCALIHSPPGMYLGAGSRSDVGADRLSVPVPLLSTIR
jgi:hypothetical protein